MTTGSSRSRSDSLETPLTWQTLLRAAGDYLHRRQVSEPRLGCEWLAARLLRCNRLELTSFLRTPVSPSHREAMRRGVRRLAHGEPVQYVLGEWDFRGHALRVDARALIPRPETEQLVQCVLDRTLASAKGSPLVADVGTGSGCIAVSLALEHPRLHCFALDIHPPALALAHENAGVHGLAERITFAAVELGALESPLLDVVVSNPPYIAGGDLNHLPRHIQAFEPLLALDGGEDGLAVIGRIARDALMKLRPGGVLWLEIGDDQGAPVRQLFDRLGYESIAILPDCTGRTRFAHAKLP